MAAVLPVGAYDAGPATAAPITWALSIACIAATGLGVLRPEVLVLGSVVPATVWTGAPGALPPGGSLATAPWLHGSALHLVYNLAALWVFGPPVERRLGSARFAAFALVTGALALAAQAAFMGASMTPVFGASGMTAACLGAFLVAHERARVSLALVFLTVPVPVRLLAAAWLAGELLTVAATAAGWIPPAPVAHVAHLTGFVLGAAILRFLPTKSAFRF